MKSIVWILVIVAVVATLLVCIAAAQQTTTTLTHKYVGAKKCKMCHNTPAKGDQYKKWLGTKHAKAFETLASEAAKKIAAEKKIGDAQKSADCLVCHTTGYGSQRDTTITNAEGVSCEACHGPGSDYKLLATMRDKTKAKEAGLIEPTKEVCIGCHNQKSPNYKEFDYEKRKTEISHPIPKQ